MRSSLFSSSLLSKPAHQNLRSDWKIQAWKMSTRLSVSVTSCFWLASYPSHRDHAEAKHQFSDWITSVIDPTGVPVSRISGSPPQQYMCQPLLPALRPTGCFSRQGTLDRWAVRSSAVMMTNDCCTGRAFWVSPGGRTIEANRQGYSCSSQVAQAVWDLQTAPVIVTKKPRRKKINKSNILKERIPAHQS